MSLVTIPALTTIVDRQFKEDRTLCPVRALRFYLDRTKDLRGSRSHLFISFKKGHTSDIRPATLSSWLKQTILLCYKQADQQALDLVQVKAYDIWAFAASKAFYGGVSVDQIMQACHWKAHNTFTNFYLKDLTWSDTDNNWYLGPDPKTQVKTCLDCKMFDVSNWVACLNGENGPGGTPSHEALSVSSQGALEISSVAGQPPSLDRSHCSPPRLVAKSLKRDERCRPSSQRPQYPTLYQRLKRRLGRSLRPKFYKGSVVRSGKKATHKCPRIEGGLPGPSRLQGPVPESNSVSCNGQLNSGSLHQQTRRNSLSRDVRSPVENHDLVPSLPHNIESQAHSRVPECDGRPTVQVQPSAVNRMVSAPTGVQTDLPEVVHTSCRLICHSPEPQAPTVRVSYSRPKGLGHRCSKHRLDQPHGLCVPSYGSPSQGDPKDQAMPLPDHRENPRLARDALVLGPSAALNRDPTTTPSVNDPTQTVPQVCVPQQPPAAEPPRLVSRSGQLQEQGFSVEVAERIAAPQRSSTRTIYKSKWALFENGAEKIRWISPLHL